jgi:NAD(P)-dependent dehydrogenase (short-subunit alcohol dehydrogenase family)
MSRRQPYRFAGRTAVLTGAASGIGEQLAYGLAVRGSDLVLLDRDAARLDQVTERIRTAHPRSSTWPTGRPPSPRPSASPGRTPASACW